MLHTINNLYYKGYGKTEHIYTYYQIIRLDTYPKLWFNICLATFFANVCKLAGKYRKIRRFPKNPIIVDFFRQTTGQVNYGFTKKCKFVCAKYILRFLEKES